VARSRGSFYEIFEVAEERLRERADSALVDIDIGVAKAKLTP
jgi:hypothetical protein